MKKNPTTSPAPAHDWERSQAVEPYRHAATGRTVGRIQDAGNGTDSHLFSATGVFIETVKTSTVAAKLPRKSKADAAPSAPTADALSVS